MTPPTRLWTLLAFAVIAFACITASPEVALAGPGGKIASGFAKTWWGQLILVVLFIVLLPLFIWAYLRERKAVQRAHAHLNALAQHYPEFDWMRLKQRASDCYQRVHDAWGHEDMERASEWMTAWYWQNQQLVNIDRWASEGLENVCRIKKLGTIKPIYVHFAPGSEDSEGSQVVLSITAKREDYLQKRATGEIVEGKKGFGDETTLWTLEWNGATWCVANIESDAEIWEYMTLEAELPESLHAAGRAALRDRS